MRQGQQITLAARGFDVDAHRRERGRAGQPIPTVGNGNLRMMLAGNVQRQRFSGWRGVQSPMFGSAARELRQGFPRQPVAFEEALRKLRIGDAGKALRLLCIQPLRRRERRVRLHLVQGAQCNDGGGALGVRGHGLHVIA